MLPSAALKFTTGGVAAGGAGAPALAAFCCCINLSIVTMNGNDISRVLWVFPLVAHVNIQNS